MRDGLQPVTITAREIYDALLGVRAAVDRLSDRVEAIASSVDDHEDRLRTGERLRWPLPSVAIAVSLATLALTVIPMIVMSRPGGTR